MSLHQHRLEQNNRPPLPDRNAVLDVPQDTVGPFGCQGTLLTHIHLLFNQNPFHRAAFQPLTPQSERTTRITPIHNRGNSQLHHRCGIQHLLMINSIWLVVAQHSNISKCLCKASLLPRKPTAPPNLMILI